MRDWGPVGKGMWAPLHLARFSHSSFQVALNHIVWIAQPRFELGQDEVVVVRRKSQD